MRQRLQLATALLGDPEILILDEPANGLDPQGIQWLRTFIRHQASIGHAVLVSSHLLSEMEETVDDVVIISQGKLVLQTTLADLANRAGTCTGMRIRTPEIDRLPRRPRRHPGRLRQTGPDTLVIDGATPEWFGPLAAQHQIVLYELVHDRGSLEDVFLQLTHGFDAGRPRPSWGPARSPCREDRRDRHHPLRVAQDADHGRALGAGRHRPGHQRPAHPGLLPHHSPTSGPNGSSGSLVSPGYTVPHTTQQLRNLVGSGLQGYLFALLLGRAHRHHRVPAQDGDHVVPGHPGADRLRGGASS